MFKIIQTYLLQLTNGTSMSSGRQCTFTHNIHKIQENTLFHFVENCFSLYNFVRNELVNKIPNSSTVEIIQKY